MNMGTIGQVDLGYFFSPNPYDILPIIVAKLQIEVIMNEYIQIDHVGKYLQEEFLQPWKLAQNALARAIDVPPNRITDIVNGKRGISADTDLRLTKLFGLSEGYFLRFQEHIETTLAKRKIEHVLKQIKPLKAAV
jgi:addiction module HigA family antidote